MIRQALIRCRDNPGTFLRFSRPQEECRGRDFQRLEEAVASTAGNNPRDTMVPPGGWVGYVTYEGEFHFTHFPEVDAVEASRLLPESLHPAVARVEETGWTAEPGRGRYEEIVHRAQEYIRAGDIYQVNLCRRYGMRLSALDPLEYFRGLWQITEAPLASYLDGESSAILSASPELFLSIHGNEIRTCPIKGTRPRDPDPLRDRQNAFELATHEKEIAELVMITDLERNDLGAICEYGSVHVPRLVQCETYSHVHHLYSEIVGTLRPGVTPVRALHACLPGGSVTGAPKCRALDIIAELEARPRGLYTGVIGYFGNDGRAQFSIAIRTAVYEKDRSGEGGMLTFGVGSGITAGSDAAAEFAETQHKARCLLQATQAYQRRGQTVVKG